MRIKALARLLLSGMLFLGASLPVYAQDTETADYRLETDVPYQADGAEAHLLDIYGKSDAAEKMPVIIEIHGGGLIGGNKETNAGHSNYYAEQGFAVIAPNYTLLPEGTFQTAVQDLFSVFTWVEENADTYNLDPENVFLSGDSTGGYYVFMLAAVLSSQENQDYYEVTPPSCQIRGYAATCPRTSVQVIRDAYEDEDSSGPNSYIAGVIGGEILENDEIMDHADLYKIIDADTFPEIYFLSSPEDTNYYGMSTEMDEFLTEKNIPHIFKEYTGSEEALGHVFNVQDITLPESVQANDGIIEYFKSLI